MDNLYYSELKLQSYFKIPGIQTREVLNIFKWRVRMAPLGENYRGNNGNIVCPLCHTHLDNQNTIFQCEILRKETDIQCELKDIYCQNIKIETALKLTEIEEIREKLLKTE
jgi:hypothetical protein